QISAVLPRLSIAGDISKDSALDHLTHSIRKTKQQFVKEGVAVNERAASAFINTLNCVAVSYGDACETHTGIRRRGCAGTADPAGESSLQRVICWERKGSKRARRRGRW